MKIKHVLAVASAVVLTLAVSSCGSKSAPAASEPDQVEVFTPFAGFVSDLDNFRFVGMGTSPDQATAGKISRLNARTELASMIEATVKAVTEQYINQIAIADKVEFKSKMEENALVAVNEVLAGSAPKESKTYKSKDGKYTTYTAMELPRRVVEEAVIEKISKDEKTALEFDQFMFKKTFDAEMEKLAAERQ